MHPIPTEFRLDASHKSRPYIIAGQLHIHTWKISIALEDLQLKASKGVFVQMPMPALPGWILVMTYDLCVRV